MDHGETGQLSAAAIPNTIAGAPADQHIIAPLPQDHGFIRDETDYAASGVMGPDVMGQNLDGGAVCRVEPPRRPRRVGEIIAVIAVMQAIFGLTAGMAVLTFHACGIPVPAQAIFFVGAVGAIGVWGWLLVSPSRIDMAASF